MSTGAAGLRARGRTQQHSDMRVAAEFPIAPRADGPQPSVALQIARGTVRMLTALGFASLTELGLATGRRADIVALGKSGDIWVVEIKSSIEDFRADHKWPGYREHCDRLFFATALDVPAETFPGCAGLIIADAFGAMILRDAPAHPLPAARRRSMTLRFARTAAARLGALTDPAQS
jgi:hypothetical protein